jgi:hypothetical protein
MIKEYTGIEKDVLVTVDFAAQLEPGVMVKHIYITPQITGIVIGFNKDVVTVLWSSYPIDEISGIGGNLILRAGNATGSYTYTEKTSGGELILRDGK